jgi:hypothetical protein
VVINKEISQNVISNITDKGNNNIMDEEEKRLLMGSKNSENKDDFWLSLN